MRRGKRNDSQFSPAFFPGKLSDVVSAIDRPSPICPADHHPPPPSPSPLSFLTGGELSKERKEGAGGGGGNEEDQRFGDDVTAGKLPSISCAMLLDSLEESTQGG